MKLLLFVLAFVLVQVNSQTRPDVITGLLATGQFSVFTHLLNETNVTPFIVSSPHFTLFAPTDHAFSKLPTAAYNELMADHKKMTDLVSYHVVLTSTYKLPGIQDTILKSSNNHTIRINIYNILHTITANGVNITVRNVPVIHGLVHGLDSILTIPTSNTLQVGINRPDLSVFANLVISAGLLRFFTTDTSQTLFIPNNDAFKKLNPGVMTYLESHTADLAETLKFHLVKSTVVFTLGMRQSMTLVTTTTHHDALVVIEGSEGEIHIDQANIIEKDIIATDGVIHILDTVLIPTRVVVAMSDQGVVIG